MDGVWFGGEFVQNHASDLKNVKHSTSYHVVCRGVEMRRS